MMIGNLAEAANQLSNSFFGGGDSVIGARMRRGNTYNRNELPGVTCRPPSRNSKR